MNKLFLITPIICSMGLFTASEYNGNTTAAVTLAGGIIKAQNTPIEKKYPRKQCPVCKGSGKYWSGDGIKQVDCGYCEPEKTSSSPKLQIIKR